MEKEARKSKVHTESLWIIQMLRSIVLELFIQFRFKNN